MRYVVEVARDPKPLREGGRTSRSNDGGLPEGTAHSGASGSRSRGIDQGRGQEGDRRLCLWPGATCVTFRGFD